MAENLKTIATNKKAFHDYFVEESLECGIELCGTEVKSIRRGGVNLKDSWCDIDAGEVFVKGMHISPYEKGNIFNREPTRVRKLLLHKKDDMELYLEKLEEKFKSIAGVGGVLAEIPVMVSMVRAYIRGDYKVVNVGSGVAIVCALIYFMSPIDLIPDVVPGAGQLDDVAVIGFALKIAHDDLLQYEEWRKENKIH